MNRKLKINGHHLTSKMINKKALSWSIIIMVIFTIITFIFIFWSSVSYSKSAEIELKEFNCKAFFTSVDSGEKYFSKTNDVPTQLFSNSITNICPSKTVEVSKISVNNAVELIKSCYSMTSKGRDILKYSQVKDKAICLYCGEIKSNDNIDDFSLQLSKKLKVEKTLFENSEIINTNEFFLEEKYLPKMLTKENPISVFYYIYRPDYNEGINLETKEFKPIGQLEFTENFYREKLSYFFTNQGFIGDMASKMFLTPNIQSLGGIVLSKQEKLTNENLLDKKVSIKGPFDKCLLYVPLNHYN